MPFIYRLSLTLLCLFLMAPSVHAGSAAATHPAVPWKGDLPEILKGKRPLRVLVSFSRTNFYEVRGETHGVAPDLMRAYGQYLTKARPATPIRMIFIPVPADQLVRALLDGRGDIVAAGLIDTPELRNVVAFASPYLLNTSEILVGSPHAPQVKSIDGLSGKTVTVMAGSSYAEHLQRVSGELGQKGLKPIRIMEVDSRMSTENLLKMADRSMIEYTVADSHVAEIWKTVLPNLHLFTNIPIYSGGGLAWAVRPEDTELARSLGQFAATLRKGSLVGNKAIKHSYAYSERIRSPITPDEQKKVAKLMGIFQKYGTKYSLDRLKLVALGFQESHLNMAARSPMGAVGIMQIMPSTARCNAVKIANITTADANIHAGTKYLRSLCDTYFTDLEESEQMDFTLAAYNAGPLRILPLREKAAALGLDPNKWFGNVEWVAYKEIGSETPTFVANVQMYFTALQSIEHPSTENRAP